MAMTKNDDNAPSGTGAAGPFSHEQLRQVLDFDPSSGLLSWAEPKRSWFASEFHWLCYQAMLNGRQPARDEHSQGYLWGAFAGEQVLAHRLVWFYAYGEWPDGEIDHINHNKKDNRLRNLRPVDRTTNSRNAGMRSDNTSGATGVYWDKRRSKWCAQISLPRKKTKALGRFDSFEDALRARKNAEVRYGFHANHGSDLCSEEEGE